MTWASPPIVVSMGDPGGIGLEIAAKAWAQRTDSTPPFVLVGDAGLADRAKTHAPTRIIAGVADAARAFPEALPLLLSSRSVDATPGRPALDAAPEIISAIERAVALVRSGDACALVTLPIAKASLYEAGFAFPGHTEFVAHLTADMAFDGARGPVMMLASPALRVALATIHEPLRKVPNQITARLVAHVGRVVLEALKRDFAVDAPRLAVAGLNPHAGESGALGEEDATEIAPAVKLLHSEGWDVSGPHPADSLFHAEARRRYDAALAMFHDQGLIPLKTLDFWGGVNVTLGLPIVRTSPDHGVGYDIAGKGVARPDSFEAALRVAQTMAANRARSA